MASPSRKWSNASRTPDPQSPGEHSNKRKIISCPPVASPRSSAFWYTPHDGAITIGETAQEDNGDRKESSGSQVEKELCPTVNLLFLPLQTPFDRIPIVDMSLPMKQLSVAVANACQNVGFMYIVNHGMDESITKRTFDLAKTFFELPIDVKRNVDLKRSKRGIRGYFELGSEDLNAKYGTRDVAQEFESSIESYRGDWKEGFDCGRDDVTDKEVVDCDMVDKNQWPPEKVIPGFRAGMLEYHSAIMDVAKQLMVAFAVGLQCPDDYFTSRMTRPMSTLRLLHYPPQPPTPSSDVNQIGCGAHTDYGCCTFLNQDEMGGLQVLNSHGEWIEAPPVANSLVINLGDMMGRWTNDRYMSTVHRVVNVSGKERYSIPFFLNPNVDTIIECLPTCCTETEPPKYPPEMSSVLLRKRYEDTFAHMETNKTK